MKKKLIVSMLSLLMVVIFVACSSNNTTGKQETSSTNNGSKLDKEERLVLVAGTSGDQSNTNYILLDELNKRIKERTDGRIELEIHHSGELGFDRQLSESLMLGNIDIITSQTNAIGTLVPKLQVLDMPYILDPNNAYKLWSSDIGKELIAETENNLNAKVLAIADGGGARLLGNSKRTVKVPEDLKNLRVRGESEIDQSLFKAWGANPTPVSYAETYNALEQKVIDGNASTPNWYYQGSFYEVAKHLTIVDAQTLQAFAIISNKVWDKLSSEEQKIFLEAAKEASEVANLHDREQYDHYIEKLIEEGCEIYTPTNDEMVLWQELGSTVWDQYSDKFNKQFIQQIVDSQK